MAFYRKSAVTLCACAVILLTSIVFQTSECKTVSSSLRGTHSSSKVSSEKPTNVFVSIAKSLVKEAYSEFQETARRNPRLGFNLTLPMLMFPDGSNNQSGVNTTRIGTLVTNGQLGMSQFGTSLLTLKKTVTNVIVTVLAVIFLITGIGYFICNIGLVSCSNLEGGLSNLGSLDQLGAGANPFSRTGYDYLHPLHHRQTSAVYNAIDDGHKKYT